MNFTLHLTEKCNFRCTYCKHKTSEKELAFEDICSLIELSKKYSNKTGFCFYGGEPFLAYSLLEKTIEYCKTYEKKCGHIFSFKMNSNGSLFTEDKLKYLTDNGVEICMSHDGLMQHVTKPDACGNDTSSVADMNARLLLKYQKNAAVQTVFAPESCEDYASSIEHLYNLGFRRILAVYAAGADWQDCHLKILKKQYEKISVFYKNAFMNDEPFYLSYIDNKIKSGFLGESKSVCHMGKGQFNVDVDGLFYPCSQFVKKQKYCLGDCKNGFDTKKMTEILTKSTEPETCKSCTLKNRCRNSCGCLNLSETGEINTVSPFQCEHERLIIDIADSIAEELYEKSPKKFTSRYK